MQAEVTGKLKQHFNNALPKQNSTTTGVSVIMVSGTQSSASESQGWPSWSCCLDSQGSAHGSWCLPCSCLHGGLPGM